MISGATRGQGIGDALARHLLNPENEAVVVIPARGLGSTGLSAQVRELVALSLGGRTDRPIYHVHLDPDAGIADEAAARAQWWAAFETEFGMGGQPFCGVEHVKHGRHHEHRIYGLVRPDGSVIDLAWDYPRREKVSRIVEHAFGMAPVASKHARSLERRLREEGRPDVADWLARSGSLERARPIAPLTPAERLQQERSDTLLAAVRRAALAAWRESADGQTFVAALRSRGLDLRHGRKGPVIVDGSGSAHLATRVIGAAARRFEGKRILAATVKERIGGLTLEVTGHGRNGNRAQARCAGSAAAGDRRDAGAGARRDGGLGIRGPDRGTGRPNGGGGRGDGGGASSAFGRLRALSPGQALMLRRHLSGMDPALAASLSAAARARAAIDRIEGENAYEKERAWRLWGMTDIWGIPLR